MRINKVTFFLTTFFFLLLAFAITCGSDDEDEGGDNTHEDDDTTQDDDSTDDDDAEDSFDVTFFVVSDTHCNGDPDMDQTAMVRAINKAAQEGHWPAIIEGSETSFIGGPIGNPLGVVFTGDLTGSGDVSPWNNELDTFKQFYEPGTGQTAIDFTGYAGFGNHDLDRDDILADKYRNMMWQYIDNRYKGADAPVLVTNFDPDSRVYSWDWGGVHVIQTHKCVTDATNNHPSALPWFVQDLAVYAADDKPVVIFQHYGFDFFGTQDRWWTAKDREDLRLAIEGYNVIAIFAGHSHAAMKYTWQDIQVFQTNNAKAEIDEGNDDGNGSFSIVRITDSKLEMMTCRWLSEKGDFEFIAPFFSE